MKKGDSIHKDKVGSQEWVEMATWCNDNGYYMKEDGDFYVIEKVPIYIPTSEDMIRECRLYLSDTDWVDAKIDELYKKKLVELMAEYGSMSDEAWNKAILYLASLRGKYASVLTKREEARNTINRLDEKENDR